MFGKRLITNNFRAIVVEAMVASALEPVWRWCSADWAGWDFERPDGLRLEVKQSAARQTWQRSDGRPSACSFDIKPRKGRYEGGTEWLDDEGRYADLYVFAHHHVADEAADHGDPLQWHFYVVPASDLPATLSIGLRRLKALAEPSTYADLKMTVEVAAGGLRQDQKPRVRAD